MAIQGGRIQKANNKSLNAKGKGKGKGKGKDKPVYISKPKNPKPSAKEHLTKDDAYHHYKEVGYWKRNYPVYLAELIKKKKQVGTASSSRIFDNCHYAPTITRGVVSVSRLVDNGFIQCFTDYRILVSKNNVLYFNAIISNGIYEIDMINRVPNVNSIYTDSNKRAKHNLDSAYLWHCHLAYISKKCIEKLQHDGLLKSMDEESFDKCVSCLSGKMTRKLFPHHTERVTDLLGIIHTDVCGLLRHVSRQDYALEIATRILNMVPTKKIDKTPYELWNGKVPNLSYLNSGVVRLFGRAEELEEIQDEDTLLSENSSEIPIEVEGFEPPQEEVVLILDLPPNYKTVGSKWLFKKKTDMDSIVHPYKARLVVNGFTQTYMVDYEETFSPVADIRAIRILIAIAAFYGYEIWKMDVKSSFLNSYLDEDIYMV
ncbi:retrotransposon protein, putative, ty1-copia subclass [Tanacetum coccineum]